jgi:hypothetical protein
MSWGSWWNSLFAGGSVVVPPPRRLDGRSKMLLGHSIKMLPYDTSGGPCFACLIGHNPENNNFAPESS